MKRISSNETPRPIRSFLKGVDRALLIALSIAMIVVAAGCRNDGADSRWQGGEAGQQAQGQSREATYAGPEQGEAGESQATAEHAEQSVQGDRVVVSRSIEFARVNDRPYGVFEAKKEIAAFAKAVRTANKMKGQLDIDFPDYDVVIDQDGKRKSIHLWLDQGSKKGMFTYVSDTGTGYTLTEQATKELIDLIWGIEYDWEKAAANGDVVATLSGTVLNPDEWLTFVDNVRSGEHDEVQVVHYTKEGGPVFRNLIFNGDSLRLRHDTTHDAFGTPMDRTDFCAGIQAEETDQGTVYMLEGCGDQQTWFELVLPGE